MKLVFIQIVTFFLFAGATQAQGYIDLMAYQRGANMASQQMYQQQMMQQQLMMQEQMLNQQRYLDAERRALAAQNLQSEFANTPEWQPLHLRRRDSKASGNGLNHCVYSNIIGAFFYQGQKYGEFTSPISTLAKCPEKLYVSKSTSQTSATKPR